MSSQTSTAHGEINSVSGPVVTATGLDAQMNDVVYVGEEGQIGRASCRERVFPVV